MQDWDSISSFTWLLGYTLVSCIMFNTLLLVVLKLAVEITFIGFRQPLEFPIEGEKSLTAGMSQQEDDVTKYLAFSDFQDLTVSSASRRREIFSISDPGTD